jgi:hypothetical protein
MAALQCEINIPTTTLAANVATTVAVVKAPTNQRVKILGFNLSFNGTTNSAQPVLVNIGTFTGGSGFQSATPNKNEPELTETVQTTANTWKSGQTEGTFTNYRTITIHPQLAYEYLAPSDQPFFVAGGTQWGLQCNAQAGVGVQGYVKFEE